MTTHGDDYCGGDPTKIEIIYPVSCTTKNLPEFDRGDNLIWTGNDLGSCQNLEMETEDRTVQFKIKTSSGEDMCPKYLTVKAGAREYQSTLMDHWHDDSDNNDVFVATRTSKGELYINFYSWVSNKQGNLNKWGG